VRQHLRRQEPGRIIRYFGVGEYGSKTERPHYHVFLFGLMPWERLQAERLWTYGHCMWAHDSMNTKLAEYTAGYTVKKEGKDVIKLGGRCPEFSRMSLRPAIGAGFARKLGESITQNQYATLSLGEAGDVPFSVKFQGKDVPLGRTLRRYVRQAVGWDSDLSDSQKAELAWLRSELFVDESVQAERARRREAGARRAVVRQTIFAKKESL